MKESLIFGFVCLFSYLGRILLTTLLYTNNAAHMYVCGSRAQICKFGMDRCLDVLFIISDSAVNLTHSISDSSFFYPPQNKARKHSKLDSKCFWMCEFVSICACI